MADKIKLVLTKSINGRLASHKACVVGLGLHRIGQSIEVEATAENRGMINKVAYLLSVEEA